MPGLSNPEIVSAYAARFNKSALGDHAVASPLGLWLLLALVGPASSGASRCDLEVVLGTTVDDAAARAGALLRDPHPAVSALTAVWDRELGPDFENWVRTLPEVVERGPIPDQARADAWAQARTNGLITEFPLQLDELTRLVLASALAADIGWAQPLGTTTELGGPFGDRIGAALMFRDGIQLVVDTDAAGLVAVAAPPSSSALDVFSVIAAPEVAARCGHRGASGGGDAAGRWAHCPPGPGRGPGRRACLDRDRAARTPDRRPGCTCRVDQRPTGLVGEQRS